MGSPGALLQPEPPTLHDVLWIDSDEQQVPAIPIPRCKAIRNAALSHTSGSPGGWQKIPFDTVVFDDATNPMFDLANGRIVARVAGVFDISTVVTFITQGTGVRASLIYKNGNPVAYGTIAATPPATLGGVTVASTSLALIAGDYLELFAFQNSGANLAYGVGEPALAMTVSLRSADIWVNGALPPLVANLPALPVDGQEVYYRAGTNGPIWHLRYSAAMNTLDGYGWEFVGGSQIATSAQTSTALSATITGALVSLTPPLSGLYEIDFGANLYISTAGQNADCLLYLGGAPVTNAICRGTTVNTYTSAMSMWSPLTVAVGNNIDLRGITSSGAGSMGNRWLRARPIRVKR
jgi:hypothetical protein